MSRPTERSAVVDAIRSAAWLMGAPFRLAALGFVRLYRVSFGQAVGGRCRYYPSCSAYAEEALRDRGFVVGVLLSAWRLLRCNPFSQGGFDRVPKADDVRLYDYITHRRSIPEVTR